MEILLSNWAEIVLALIVVADIIVSATPSKKDDQILGYIRIIVNALTARGRKKR